MRAVCCPDSFKGALSARDAAAALATGFERAGVEVDQVPLADGGEGTAEVISLAAGGEWRATEVADALGRRVQARYLSLPDGRAVVESAEAIGLERLTPDERDPMAASSQGLGELIEAASRDAPAGLIVTLGGSATVDGGVGMREVLGELPVPVTVACDVTNPLLGERGAARVFGPQKGATAEQVELLEERLANLSELAPYAELRGAGAAGGLGAALASMGAHLVPGIDVVMDVVGLEDALRGAALAVTGEGTVDRSSSEGKVPAGVLRLCSKLAVRSLVVGGRVTPDGVQALYELGATAVVPLSGDPARTRDDLIALAEARDCLIQELDR